MNKFERQEHHYASFPYHHIPHFRENVGVRTRVLGWGLEYLCYLQHIQKIVDDLGPSSVLDVGCGDGRLLGLIQSGRERKLGIDLSQRAIGFARAFHPDIEFRVAEVLSVNEKFDVVTLIEVLEHIPDEEVAGMLSAVHDRVKDDGVLIISVPSAMVKILSKHYRHYTEDSLREALESAGIRTARMETTHLCPAEEPLYTRILERLSFNRWWTFESPLTRRLLWRWKWSTRIAKAGEGRHVLAVLRKSS